MPFNKLDDTTAGKIRPRFKLITSLTKEEIMNLIHIKAEEDPTIINSRFDRFIKLSIPKKDSHYWSPVLTLSFDTETESTVIRGLIGPRDKVWTKFMFFYVAASTLGLFGSIFAMVQWQLHDNLSFLLIIPLSIAVVMSIFLISRFGKIKAHLQMLHLLRFLRSAVDQTDCKRYTD